MKVLVFLRWPEKCFRADADDLRYLRSLLRKGAEVVEARSERAFLKALPSATHVITWYFRAEWYALASELKLLATPAAGRELIAMPPSAPGRRSAVPVVHFGHYHGAIMSESVAAFCLAWARGFFLKQPGVWPRTWMGGRCRTLAGTKAVIAGYGNVGRAIGGRLAALGVSVRGLSHAECDLLKAGKAGDPRRQELLSLLREADWFILALPSDTGTDGFADAKLFAKLPRKCVLVNVGRGNAVDEQALEKALGAGRLAGAYLDVLRYEPHYLRCNGFTEATRKQSKAFLEGRVPNCIVMPHASAFSSDYLKRCFAELKADGQLT